jgi:hypothetical protein
MCATSAQSKQSPCGLKFAESGHPASKEAEGNEGERKMNKKRSILSGWPDEVAKYRPKCSPTHFLTKSITQNFFRGTVQPQIWSTSVHTFRKTAQRKESPERRKFAQSGRPARLLVHLSLLAPKFAFKQSSR